jgi:hypothetical protein
MRHYSYNHFIDLAQERRESYLGRIQRLLGIDYRLKDAGAERRRDCFCDSPGLSPSL